MAEMAISHAGRDSIGIPDDPLKASDRILMKVALEGKSFQEARDEVHREQSSFDQSKPAPDADQAVFSQAALDLVEIHATQVTVHLEGHGETLDASLTSVNVRALRVRAERQEPKPKDPLVLDLTGDGPETTGASGAKAFDLAGDGDLRGTSYVKGGTAFLALDRNANGVIDSGAELFGDQHGAVNGYAELAKFDGNGDGRIDAADPVYSGLKVLFGDGTTRSIAEAGIASLEIQGTPSGGTTSGGDAIFAQGKALLANGGSITTYALGLNRFDLQA